MFGDNSSFFMRLPELAYFTRVLAAMLNRFAQTESDQLRFQTQQQLVVFNTLAVHSAAYRLWCTVTVALTAHGAQSQLSSCDGAYLRLRRRLCQPGHEPHDTGILLVSSNVQPSRPWNTQWPQRSQQCVHTLRLLCTANGATVLWCQRRTHTNTNVYVSYMYHNCSSLLLCG